jgi:hypothetical protein
MKSFMHRPVLLCFSPPVMIATIIIEVSLAIWVSVKYMTSSARRLILAILFCLAAFQLAEFNVCSPSVPSLVWSRIGYVFITFLPPLGIHLITKIRREQRPRLLAAAYTAASAFAVAFAFLSNNLNRGVCAGNYVIFVLAQPLAMLYGLYYLGFVAVGLALTRLRVKNPTSKTPLALNWMTAGYVAFTLPTIIINFLLPMTRLGIPSIMCGFAVLLALILGLKVAPLTDMKARSSS